jgi:hypothetical protein
MTPEKPDDKTLVLLMAIAELMNQKSDAQAMSILYERKAKQLQDKPPY